MPGMEFDLDALHHILGQFSKDITGDCSRLIESLLNSESSLNNSLEPQNKTALASVKVLLCLFEKLHSSSNPIKTGLPVSVIVQDIKCVLQCSNEECHLPDTDIQCNLLLIVSSLFKNVILQNSQKNLEELAEFYAHILSCLHTVQECKSDCLIFKLKILNSIYHALTCVPNLKFIETLKSINNLDECQVFSNLVLHQNDDVAIQTLMHLIPMYINCFQNERVVQVTWKQISKTMMHSSNEFFRALIVLCNFFDVCFDKSKVEDKVDLTKLLLEDVNYLKLVQFALVDGDPVKRKQGMFLFKKTLDLLDTTDRNFVCGAENIFYWHPDCKDELHRIYSEIIICLEFLEEQQVHIIKPILKMVEELSKKIVEYDAVNCSWVLLLHKKTLMHESTQIVKWGLSHFLKLPGNFFLQEHIAKECFTLLVDTLNNMSLYYNNGLALSRELNDFYNKVVRLNNSKLFFSSLIKGICSQVWSAEALFFVMHSFSGIQEASFWGAEEISEIGMFVSKAFKTHNKTIRTGIQCELLNAVTHLTDKKSVPLQSIVLLISKFCMEELAGSQAWNDFTKWLKNYYSNQEAVNALEKYKKRELFNEKLLSLMLILFDCVFCPDAENSSAVSYVQEISLSFREIHKRPYCDKSLLDQYLAVVCCIYEANLNYFTNQLVKPSLPFIREILLYIQSQLQQISNLQDFNTCESYLNSFHIIIKTLLRLDAESETVSDFYVTVLKDLGSCLSPNSSISPIGIYWRIKQLSIILELHSPEPKPRFLVSYLLTTVNEPLRKDSDDSKKTRDLQTLWGRMNSQFIEGKWKILERLIGNKLIVHWPSNVQGATSVGKEALVGLCLEALNSGGYGVLCPIMCVLKDLLPVLEDLSEVRRMVDSVWKQIMERRKTEEFKQFIGHFVEFLFQKVFILKGDPALQILFEYSDLILSDSSLAVVNIFMKHIQQADIGECSVPLFCHVMGRALLFGPVQKKDERLTNQVCSHIESLKICHPGKIGDYNTCNEIRARAVEAISRLDPTSPTDQAAGKSLIEALLKLENEMNKNRTRYFGNSHVHRVKHRLMQSLLLLEPMLKPNEDQAKELCHWLYRSLMTENSQPSVRYQQEWLLVRMLLRHSDLSSRYSICSYNKDSEESSKRSLCSIMAVSYHLCKLSSSGVLEELVATTMEEIFSFCFHQHFEVRLYAQVVFHKLYSFAKNNNLGKVTEKFQFINMSLGKIFETHLKGNFGKNLEKMLEDFYFTKFNPLNHFTLETVYMELPRLTNVDSDEWISAEIFQACGIIPNQTKIPLKNSDPFTEYFSNEDKWQVEKFNSVEMKPHSEMNVGNYQKKIIPQKPLIPGWDENCTSQTDEIKKDGLIVVASLIDRIPNLGGLARTCEIFGASEYVVGSLRYTEDKQFTSLSVTAEKWISIKEVKAQNLLDYIFEMKLKGYTVIGAEQMLHSIPLGSAKFPKKSLLLLGNEKEGIPPNLLPLLDICIEIPQLGIIRSLNVHVTGALFIWEYTKQNHFS